jgi:hypothetical protein
MKEAEEETLIVRGGLGKGKGFYDSVQVLRDTSAKLKVDVCNFSCFFFTISVNVSIRILTYKHGYLGMQKRW